MKLEHQFPIKFVFEQIYNEELSLEIRSLFCDLALTLYIDQEPLNARIVPNLCRMFKKKKLDESSELITSMVSGRKNSRIDETTFANLLKKIMQMLEDEKVKIQNDMRIKFKGIDSNQIRHVKIGNHLNNILLAKLIRLISKMTSFDLLPLIGGNESYFKVVHDIMHILEFDKNFVHISYSLTKLRGKVSFCF